MGSGNVVCHNAANQHGRGWSRPLSVWNAAQLPPGVWSTLTLPAQYMTDTNLAIVRPTWLADPFWAASTLYISYRVARGSDSGLFRLNKNMVIVHSYAGSQGLKDRNLTYLVANVSDGGTWPLTVSEGGGERASE